MTNDIFEQILSKFNKKRILLTGSSGYIGSRASLELDKYGAEVLGIDKDVIQSSIDQEEFSLTSAEKLDSIIKKFKPDLIFHSGTNSASDYYNHFLKSFNEDYNSLTNILRSIDKFNNKDVPIVFFSSSYVYSGEPKNTMAQENNKLQPNHNFGVGKRFFEEMLKRSHKNYDIYRLSSVYGKGNPRKPNAIFNMIEQANKEKKIDLWGIGERKMQYVSIDDVIKHSLGPALSKPDVYNLGSDNYLSTSEVVKCIAKATKVNVSVLKNKQEGETLPFMENKKIKETNNLQFDDVLENIFELAKK